MAADRIDRRVLRDGIVLGLIGYFAVALFYAIFDIAAARGSLFTVNLLGRALFRGLRDPGVLFFPLALDMPAILSYNALHLVAALCIGPIITAIVVFGESGRGRAILAAVLIVGGFLITVVAIGGLTAAVRPVLPWWSIVGANLLATLLGAAYLMKARPGLLHRLAGR